MKKLFGGRKDSEQTVREALRKKNWSRAIAWYETKLGEHDRDFGMWNRLGDLYIRNRAKAQAVESWRRSIEGYSAEGLYENVLGVARKVIRLAPDEEDVHLILAETYLSLEYHADCLASLRSYLKLAKRPSEQDVRSLIKKILGSQLHHGHLVEELKAIFSESGIEDFELEQKIQELSAKIESEMPARAPRRAAVTESATDETVVEVPLPTKAGDSEHGLIVLDGLDSFNDGHEDFGMYQRPVTTESAPEEGAITTGRWDAPAVSDSQELPAGEGKDHYDLGSVYREMKLWDAAIAEFEQARKDSNVRVRATLALAECMMETHDLQGALTLLEDEQSAASLDDEKIALTYQAGLVHEVLGNLDEALTHFRDVQRQNASYQDVETRIAGLSGRINSTN